MDIFRISIYLDLTNGKMVGDANFLKRIIRECIAFIVS